MIRRAVAIISLLAISWEVVSFSPSYSVIESDDDVQPEAEVHLVSEDLTGIKLRCHDFKGKTASRTVDIIWEYKRCGHGLSLTACEELPESAPWKFAMCRNATKLCTGSTLPILQPDESESGLYRCLHKNYMEQRFRVNRVIQLEIQNPHIKSIEILPELPEMDNQTVYENQTVVLRCRVRSISYPHIIWARSVISGPPSSSGIFIDGTYYQFLNASQTHDGPNRTYTSKWYLNSVRLDDSGQYVCFALDARHNITKVFSLNVIPLLSYYRDASTVSKEIWGVTMALVLSAVSCILVLCFLFRRKSQKMISVPGEEMLEESPSPASSIC